ncbi:MAG TPA: hypothetical protein VNL18_14505 [Gemmatimonadales bacterium]|nr:hypothetical protein [Gemmatimonadales bacterium]
MALVLTAGCGPKRVTVQVPPRLDLGTYGRVGLVTFTVEKAKGTLHELATERFSEEILAAQPGIEVLELGPQDSLVRRVGEAQFGPAAAQALGKARRVPAVFAGHLVVSDVKPSGGILGLRVPFVEATVSVELTVRLLSTESGGTIWRASAAASEKVGEVSLIGGEPFFSAKNPNDAYGELVNHLVVSVTQDLRPTWRRQEVRGP